MYVLIFHELHRHTGSHVKLTGATEELRQERGGKRGKGGLVGTWYTGSTTEHKRDGAQV